MAEKIFNYLTGIGILVAFFGMCIAKYFGQIDLMKFQASMIVVFIFARIARYMDYSDHED